MGSDVEEGLSLVLLGLLDVVANARDRTSLLSSENVEVDRQATELERDTVGCQAKDYKKNLKKMAKANPVHKAQFYAATGIELTYHPDRDVVEVTALPHGVLKNVSEGGLEPPRPCGH